MRYDILLSILFELFEERRLTASYLAEKHALSPRTIYRYVRKLAAFVPLDITQGRAGGITLADSYRLPVGLLSKAEYAAVNEALAVAYASTANPLLLSTKRKLAQTKAPLPATQIKTGVHFIPAKGEENAFAKLALLEQAIKERRVARLLAENGLPTRAVEPHALVFHGGEWHLRALRRGVEELQLLPLREIEGVLLTEEYFHPHPSIL